MKRRIAIAFILGLLGGALLSSGLSRPAQPPRQPKSSFVPDLLAHAGAAEKAPEEQSARAGLAHEKQFINSIGMKLNLIPPGEFLMGSPDTDKDAIADEKPQHKVRISRPFYLGMYTVTVGQFRAFVKDTGYKTEPERNKTGGWRTITPAGKIEPGGPQHTWDNVGFPQTDAHPVTNLAHGDAEAFCKWLSKKEGKTYRLPTEAEWEYACRAGTTTRWYCGDDPGELDKVANIVIDNFARSARDEPSKIDNCLYLFTAPVGQFQPNKFGLHDMHGNVLEWCADWYGEDEYRTSPAEDPQGPREGDRRITRGGNWIRGALDCRSANRRPLIPAARSLWLGFRAVCETKE